MANQIHFTRGGGRFICLSAREGDAKTTASVQVTCRHCLKSLIREAVPGTKLAGKLMAQFANLKG